MTQDDLKKLLDRMAMAVAKRPTPAQMSLMIESILDNRLTAAEVKRGYIAIRDAQKPWWPTPGEFLAVARPPASTATVQSEASRLFDLIRDHGELYGRYSPETGVVRDRRLIEQAFGTAAGLAFVAAGGSAAFAGMTEKSEPWVRKAFQDAYEVARADHGAPLTLEAKRLPAPRRAAQITGKTEPGEQEKKFRELFGGGFSVSKPSVDVDARLAELRRQAQEIAQ